MPFHSGYGYYGTGDWLWSLFSTALFIVLVALAVTLLVRILNGSRRPNGPGPGPANRVMGASWFGGGPNGGPGGGGGGGSGPGGGVGGAPEATTRPAWRNPEAASAERILAERYARGELTEEEYRGRLEVLRQAATGWARPGQGQPPPAEAGPVVSELQQPSAEAGSVSELQQPSVQAGPVSELQQPSVEAGPVVSEPPSPEQVGPVVSEPPSPEQAGPVSRPQPPT